MIPATTLAETIAALEARVAEAKKWVARQVAWETAYRLTQEAKDRAEKAEADNARLRGLLAKGISNHCCTNCPWCNGDDNEAADLDLDSHDARRIIHAPYCPAFTPEGVVR